MNKNLDLSAYKITTNEAYLTFEKEGVEIEISKEDFTYDVERAISEITSQTDLILVMRSRKAQ